VAVVLVDKVKVAEADSAVAHRLAVAADPVVAADKPYDFRHGMTF